mmetsp:Transcript_24477/g.44699  ORF Transcript_24477/g.44699 Transcript_24477/m.44699 type:complete len:232 (+) Transcript_24477:161-856(+)
MANTGDLSKCGIPRIAKHITIFEQSHNAHDAELQRLLQGHPHLLPCANSLLQLTKLALDFVLNGLRIRGLHLVVNVVADISPDEACNQQHWNGDKRVHDHPDNGYDCEHQGNRKATSNHACDVRYDVGNALTTTRDAFGSRFPRLCARSEGIPQEHEPEETDKIQHHFVNILIILNDCLKLHQARFEFCIDRCSCTEPCGRRLPVVNLAMVVLAKQCESGVTPIEGFEDNS